MCHSEGQAKVTTASDVSIFRWFIEWEPSVTYFLVAAAIW